jgi:hypothetical protein
MTPPPPTPECAAPLDIFLFKDAIHHRTHQTIVCIAERSRLTLLLPPSDLIDHFGGWIRYVGVDSGTEYLGVWGDRKASAFRRLIRERGESISITRSQPEQVRVQIRTGSGSR